jgi:Arc/MetJ-type ribon-helix-helix transcriptional regulator
MSTTTSAEALAEALQRVAKGARTRPVSVSLPGPLVEALQQLTDAGLVASTSAAATEALTQWAYNHLLRLTLNEVYEEQPELRPSPEQVRAMATRLGVVLPQTAHEVA